LFYYWAMLYTTQKWLAKKMLGKMTWFVTTITSFTIPSGILTVPSTRVRVMFDCFISQVSWIYWQWHQVYIDNGIKFTFDPISYMADLKVIFPMEHRMVRCLKSFHLLGIVFLTMELQVWPRITLFLFLRFCFAT